jgi:hypothetical protein
MKTRLNTILNVNMLYNDMVTKRNITLWGGIHDYSRINFEIRASGGTSIYILYHHQPINVPTAGAQVFLMDYT